MFLPGILKQILIQNWVIIVLRITIWDSIFSKLNQIKKRSKSKDWSYYLNGNLQWDYNLKTLFLETEKRFKKSLVSILLKSSMTIHFSNAKQMIVEDVKLTTWFKRNLELAIYAISYNHSISNSRCSLGYWLQKLYEVLTIESLKIGRITFSNVYKPRDRNGKFISWWAVFFINGYSTICKEFWRKKKLIIRKKTIRGKSKQANFNLTNTK